MRIQLANADTGEVVEWRTELGWKNTTGLGAIRGCIRKWIKAGLSPINLDILIAEGHVWLNEYMIDYAIDYWLDMEDENELDELEDDDDFILAFDVDFFDDDDNDDDDLLTDEDIAEWQGNHN